MIMGKPVWAVVCGKMRERFEFNMTIAKLCDLRKQKLLDGIIISTWKGGIDHNSLLWSTLKDLGIQVLELNEEEGTEEKHVNMSFWIQQYQLRQALLHVPNDVFVLKSRTEYGIDKIAPFEKILRGETSLIIGKEEDFPVCLKYRIGVMRYSISGPFWLVDGGFVGYKDDILKMLPVQNNYLKYGVQEDLIQDLSFWFNPFLNAYPFFSELQSISKKGFIFDKLGFSLIRYAQKVTDEEFYLPRLATYFYVAYLLILSSCFVKMDSYIYPVEPGPITSPISIRQLFVFDPSIGMIKNCNRSCMGNSDLLNIVLNGGCKDTAFYHFFCQSLEEVKKKDFFLNLHVTQADYLELYSFIQDVLEVDPVELLEWKVQPTENYQEIDFANALKKLYADVELGEDEWKLLLDTSSVVMYKQTKQRAFSIVHQYLDKAEMLPRVLYEDILASALRVYAPVDYKNAGKGLYEGKISYNPEWIATRLQWLIKFFVEKVFSSGNTLTGAYYYCLYEAERHDNQIPSSQLYEYLSDLFGIGHEFLKDGKYDLALLPQIQQIVERFYSEIETNKIVRSMLEFLIDEFSDTGISPRVKKALLPVIVRRKMIVPFALCEADPVGKVLKEARCAVDDQEKALYASELLKILYIRPKYKGVGIEEFIRGQKDNLPNTLLWRVYFLEKKKDLTYLGKDCDLPNERDFITLLQIINEKSIFTQNEQLLIQMVGNSMMNKFALAYFSESGLCENYPFMRIRRGNEFWVKLPNIYATGIDDLLISVANNDGYFWPFGKDFPSESCFAAKYLLSEDKICLSVCFASAICTNKEHLINELIVDGLIFQERNNNENELIIWELLLDDSVVLHNEIKESFLILCEIESRIIGAIQRII